MSSGIDRRPEILETPGHLVSQQLGVAREQDGVVRDSRGGGERVGVGDRVVGLQPGNLQYAPLGWEIQVHLRLEIADMLNSMTTELVRPSVQASGVISIS